MANDSSELFRFLSHFEEVSQFCLKSLGCKLHIIFSDGEGLKQKEDANPLCQYLTSTIDGQTRCFSSYKRGCFLKEESPPFIFTCPLGLINLIFPLAVKTKPSCYIMVGPIFVKEKRELLLKYAKEIGIERKKIEQGLLSLKTITELELSSLFSLSRFVIAPLIHEIKENYELFLRAGEFIKREELIRIDNITGLHNRLYLINRLPEEMSRATRKKEDLSLILFRFDQFQSMIDIHGEKIRDTVLKETAEILLKFTRKEDVLVRGRDDEFLLLLFATDQNQAMVLGKMIIERKGEIKGKPVFWRSEVEIFPQNLIKAKQTKGPIPNMEIEWQFEEKEKKTEIVLIHKFRHKILIIGDLIAGIFVKKMADETLKAIKKRVENG
ncbi:MAG: diguanylate cyclase [bacterium]